MKTVTVKFVVKDVDEANALMNSIGEEIGNYGYPFLSSIIKESTASEVAAHKLLTGD